MKKLMLAAGFVALLVLPGLMKADTITPILTSIPPVSCGVGCWEYAYDMNVEGGSKVAPGGVDDYVTIIDFNGYIAGSIVAPADWTPSVSLTGGVPASQVGNVPDSGALVNLTWTYTGAATVLGPSTTSGFSARSIFGPALDVLDFAFANTINSGGPSNDMQTEGIGHTDGPAPVPEPISLLLFGSGLLGLGGVARRKKKNAAKS